MVNGQHDSPAHMLALKRSVRSRLACAHATFSSSRCLPSAAHAANRLTCWLRWRVPHPRFRVAIGKKRAFLGSLSTCRLALPVSRTCTASTAESTTSAGASDSGTATICSATRPKPSRRAKRSSPFSDSPRSCDAREAVAHWAAIPSLLNSLANRIDQRNRQCGWTTGFCFTQRRSALCSSQDLSS